LTVNIPVMLEGYDPDLYEVSFYVSIENAEAEENAIDNPSSYFNTSNPQTIYALVHNIQTGCSTIKTFDLIILSDEVIVVDFSYDSNVYCLNSNNPILIPAEGFTVSGQFSYTPTDLTLGLNPSTG